MDVSASIETLKGIGPKTAIALKKYGFETIKDLIYYFPRTYENYDATVKIKSLTPGKVVVKGKIKNLKVQYTRRRNFTIVTGEIYDDTDCIKVVWYNQPYRVKGFDEKQEYFFTGLYDFKYNRYQLTSPTVVLASEVMNYNQTFQPIYSVKGTYKSAWFKLFFIKHKDILVNTPNLLPSQKNHERAEALYKIHFPESEKEVEEAKKSLAYEELFELILASKLNKTANQKLKAEPLSFHLTATKKFISSLPFKLTNAQRLATFEILKDLEKNEPMNRLLQGDVGSGKTIVSAIAIYQACINHAQAVLLAPTAILATQHAETIEKILRPLKLKVGLLIGSTKNKELLKSQIEKGEVDVVIGTHAILTDDTKFKNLRLAIIDEQHRFGVMQRQRLLLKARDFAPHLLSMTATPIPRSLQLTVFGDLSISTINERPKGRVEIKTRILSETVLSEELYPRLNKKLSNQEQVYWICKKIEDGASETTSVKQQTEKVRKLFPNAKVGFLHGKMKSEEKDAIMLSFKQHEIDILVSTTVIEVGIDIPNATQIIIMDAEGFGLAQLHQLRGRVGRGEKSSDCYLIIGADKKPSLRLQELERSTNGFHLAEVDLKLRGPGEIYGQLQHGVMNLKIASITDLKTIKRARDDVEKFLLGQESMLKYKELNREIKKYQQLITLN